MPPKKQPEQPKKKKANAEDKVGFLCLLFLVLVKERLLTFIFTDRPLV